MKWRLVWILGLFSKRAHYNSAGKPKQQYNTKKTAEKAAFAMQKKTGRKFDVYRCYIYCRKYHIGGSIK